MNGPRLLDTSLRDGSHAMSHSFTIEQVQAIAGALDAAGIEVIEVSHGDGLAGGSLQSGFCATPEEELISAAVRICDRARIAVMILPGIGTSDALKRALEAGAQIVRVATPCMQADLARRHLAVARACGAEAVGFLMMSHLRPPRVLAEQARLLESYGAECVYLADSAGFMLPDDVRSRVAALKEALEVQVGFHAHNNFGAAIGNSLAALESGADQLDGSLRGLGAGAGNAATELIAAALEHMGLRTGLDVLTLIDAAEDVVSPLMTFRPNPDRDSILLGRAGVYSTFLLPARHAAEQYGVDARDVVAQLGRRQAVVGQEDLPLAIASELAHDAAVA